MSTIPSIGGVVITADGINALARATPGKRIQVTTYRASAKDIDLDPTRTDLPGWRTHEIDSVRTISDDAVEFVIDIAPTAAHDYLRSAGLYLDDGTLFALAKPPYPMPPGLRQTLKIQVRYANVTGLMTLEYLPHQEEEQDLRLNNTAAVFGVLFAGLSERVRRLSERGEAIWRAHRADKAQIERSISDVDALSRGRDATIDSGSIKRDERLWLALLNSNAVLGNEILKSKTGE